MYQCTTFLFRYSVSPHHHRPQGEHVVPGTQNSSTEYLVVKCTEPYIERRKNSDKQALTPYFTTVVVRTTAFYFLQRSPFFSSHFSRDANS